MTDAIPFLPGLSPIGEKEITITFDGGQLSSDGGVLILREIEKQLGVATTLGRRRVYQGFVMQTAGDTGRLEGHRANKITLLAEFERALNSFTLDLEAPAAGSSEANPATSR